MRELQHRRHVFAAHRNQKGVELRRRLVGGAALLQQLSENDVSHAEPQGGKIDAAQRLQQPVVAAAPAHGAQRLARVEQLEHDPGVVREPADDREIHRDEVPESHGLQGPDGLAQRLTRLLPALHLAERSQDRVEPAQGRDLEHRVGLPLPQAPLPQLGRQDILRVALTFVDRGEGRAKLLLAHPAPEQQGAQHAPIGHPDLHVARPQPKRPHDVDRGRDELRVGQRARFSQDVHIELKVLPQPSPLLPLVAEQLGDREPADRLLERLRVRPHHAGEGGSHLGAQRDLAPALVLERVQLLHDLLAALVGVQLQRLERGAVVFLKAVAPRDLAPGGEDVVLESQFVGVKVTEAW